MPFKIFEMLGAKNLNSILHCVTSTLFQIQDLSESTSEPNGCNTIVGRSRLKISLAS